MYDDKKAETIFKNLDSKMSKGQTEDCLKQVRLGNQIK